MRKYLAWGSAVAGVVSLISAVMSSASAISALHQQVIEQMQTNALLWLVLAVLLWNKEQK